MTEILEMTAATRWAPAFDETALAEGCLAPAYPFGVNVVVARVDGVVYAVSGNCVHLGCPLLAGHLDGCTLTCPSHDWRFDVRTGKFLDAPELALEVFPTRTEAGKIVIGITPRGAP